MREIFEYVDCNLCGQDNTELLFSKNEFQIVRCCNCSLVYVNPRPDEKKIRELYEEHYFKGAEEEVLLESNLQQYRFKEQLKRLERYKKNGKVLDIGCGAGYFLEVAKSNGWEPWGIEPSKFAAEEAKKKMENIFNGSIDEAEYSDNFFDLITMWQVLEHLNDPFIILKRLYRMLKKDRLLVVEVPDFNCLESKRLKERWSQIHPPLHLYYFTSLTLSNLLKKAGFSIIKIEQVPSGTGFGEKLKRAKTEGLKRYLLTHFNHLSWLKKVIMDVKKILGENDSFVAYAKKL